MIVSEHLTKSFGDTTALNDLAIHVPRGSVYGLVGPNGAGKSTFLRCLAGVYRPEKGELTIDGEPVYENAALKARIAYIPDQVFFFNAASTEDMMRYYRGLYARFDEARYHRLAQAFSFNPKEPIRRLSKGLQKQSAFWLALSMRPEILLLDEPVDGLDPIMRRQVWSLLLADVEECGTTVLVSSHNLRELEDVCDMVGILDHGKMLLERSLAELQDNVVKVQLALPADRDGEEPFPGSMPILHREKSGSVHTLILRGTMAEIQQRIEAISPLFYDLLPLTLEEIFIYELGGADRAIQNIIL